MDFLKPKSLDPIGKSAVTGSVPRGSILVCPDHLLEAARVDLPFSNFLRSVMVQHHLVGICRRMDVYSLGIVRSVPGGFSILTPLNEKQFSLTAVFLPHPIPATLGKGGCYDS